MQSVVFGRPSVLSAKNIYITWFERPRFSFKVTVIRQNRNVCTHFHANFSIDCVEIWSAALPCWLTSAQAKFVRIIDIQGRELYFRDFTKNMYKTGLLSVKTHFFQTWYDDRYD